MNFYIFNNGIISSEGMSGSDRRALEWVKIFHAKGHQIYLFVPGVGRQRYKEMKPNPRIVVTSEMDAHKIGFFLTYLWRGLRACLLQPRIEPNSIIYSSSDLMPDSLPAIYMKLRSVKARWICGLHLLAPNPFRGFRGEERRLSWPRISNLYYFLYQRLVILFIRWLSSLVLVSNNLDRNFLLGKGLSPEKIMVTYGGVNFQEVAQAKENPRYDACFVGRFHPQKGLDDLIECWQKVCAERGESRLAIVGEGNMSKQLRSIVSQRGLDGSIDFLGFLDGREKFEVMKSSKLCLFPSTYESFGMVVCEAMACGLPVVAYDLPVFKEVYPEGMLRCPAGDIDKLAENILALLTDEKKRLQLAREALKISKRYDWESTGERILERIV